ncbi:OmpH family outer membrane protein [Vibrio sp.]|uniref:Chaperone protein skp n=1 Tax=Vibrio viridaestus TaxID=2487322 RepID=A0A3N9TI25_9VIBR|nr:OmpH family outer membrane protein [Vibrio viridaestus]MDC0609885.1 OmpH family outer membrane protein [Vibrio sp.]RQW63948.1 molecular chaperone [Vibrio viridaestus]
MLKNLVKAAGVSLVILSSSLFAHAAEAAQKIAYINTAKVFQSLPQREVALQKMQNEFKDKANELQSLKEEIKTKVEKLKRDSSLMNSDEVEKLRIDIGQLDSKYKIKAQALEKASSSREAEEKHKLFKIIQDAVAKVAKKEGYDMVIDVQTMQYGNPAYDISDQVIKQLK